MDIKELYKLYRQFPSIQTDTRKLKKDDFFFALKGPNFNANTFVAQAFESGAAYVVIDDANYKVNDRCIVVSDVLTTLQQLATHHRMQFDIPVIAITGSNGKTTTKELVTSVLGTRYKTYATEGNLNNHIGVPLTLLKVANDAEIVVVEMGANHQREIASYCEIARPTHGIITNCGKAHLEGFGGIEGVRKGKGELYDYLRESGGAIFRNSDLDYLKEMAHDIRNQITYGSANADYLGKPIMDDVFLSIAMLNSGLETTIRTHLVGAYNFPNVMVAVAVGLHLRIDIEEIKKAIASYNPDNSRSQWIEVGSNKVIADAYNANPSSMRAAIINFANASLEGKNLWLGGMKEMGSEEQKEHADLLELIEKYNWDQVILVGNEFKQLKGTYHWFENSAEAANYIRQHPPVKKSILLKGSRGSKMELMLQALREV